MLFLILCCVAFLLYRWIHRSHGDPPQFSGGLPIIGHAHLLTGDNTHAWNFLKRVAHECLAGEQACTLSVGRKFYVITDPDDYLTVANTCLQKDSLYDFGKPSYGDGLITAPVHIWKRHRKMLNPAFNRNNILGFLGVFNKQARLLVKEFSAKAGRGPFNHEPYLHHNAIDTICVTALGVDFKNNNVVNTKYIQATDTILNIIIKRTAKVWLHYNLIWNLSSLKKIHDANMEVLHNVSDMMLKKRKTNYLSNKIDNNEYTDENFKPLLDQLFELKPSFGQETLSDQTIREHVDTFIVAGIDTVACTLLYTMLLIGSYPQVQEKIFAELQEIFGESDRDVTKEDFTRLVYLECVIKEAMRIYPVAPVIVRHLDRDIKLKNHTLTSGYACILSIYGIFRHTMWGEDAEQFKPERWLEPSKMPGNPNAFVAFSLGRRDCIGKTYAMLSMKTTLSHILRNYRISGDHTKMINKYDFIFKPVSGHYISVERRI